MVNRIGERRNLLKGITQRGLLVFCGMGFLLTVLEGCVGGTMQNGRKRVLLDDLIGDGSHEELKRLAEV